MKKNYIKIFSFILCLVMLLGTFLLVIGAEAEYTPVEWTLAEDISYISDGKTTYQINNLPNGYFLYIEDKFCYINTVSYNNKIYKVYSRQDSPSIINIICNGSGYSFANSQGALDIDALYRREGCKYLLEGAVEGEEYMFEEDLAKSLDSYARRGKKQTIDVSELKDIASVHHIEVYDPTLSVGCEYGAIYLIDDKTYYLSFADLGNQHFDANGYFSYRSGTVQITLLSETLATRVWDVIFETEPIQPKITYEKVSSTNKSDDYDYDDDYDDDYDYYDHLDPKFKFGSIVCFFAITIIVGIMIPAVLIVLGIVFARSKKTNQAKCWYALSASAALWLLSALLFLLLVII